MAKEVNIQNFDEFINSNKPVVIDFWAEWCVPCQTVAPLIEDISNEYEGKAEVLKCNIDENPELATKLGIRNIQTVLYFKGGSIVDKQIGSGIKSTFTNKLLPLLT